MSKDAHRQTVFVCNFGFGLTGQALLAQINLPDIMRRRPVPVRPPATNAGTPPAGLPARSMVTPEQCRALVNWMSILDREYPQVNFRATALDILARKAANLFRDEYFQPFYGKPIAQTSDNERLQYHRTVFRGCGPNHLTEQELATFQKFRILVERPFLYGSATFPVPAVRPRSGPVPDARPLAGRSSPRAERATSHARGLRHARDLPAEGREGSRESLPRGETRVSPGHRGAAQGSRAGARRTVDPVGRRRPGRHGWREGHRCIAGQVSALPQRGRPSGQKARGSASGRAYFGGIAPAARAAEGKAGGTPGRDRRRARCINLAS